MRFDKLSAAYKRLRNVSAYDMFSLFGIGSTRGLSKEKKAFLKILSDGKKQAKELEIEFEKIGLKQKDFDTTSLWQNYHELERKGYVDKDSRQVGLPYFYLTRSGRIAARKLD